MPYEDKLKDVEGNIPFNIVIRGGGGFGPVWGYVEGNISFDMMARRGWRILSLTGKKQINATSFSTLCSEGVAGLIPYEDKLAVISHSTKCSEGVEDLVSNSLFLVSDSWACLVSDSRILVSDSQFLVSDSYSV